jgi:DNA-binding transcriptional LysR family regulator
MSFNLDHLRYIRAICAAGSFRKAAEQLGINQPTLSRRVERMEKELGASLFERDRGHSRPTALAELIAERSADLLNSASSLVTEAQRISAGTAGAVRIGMGPAPVISLLRPLGLRLASDLPAINLDIRTGDSAHFMDLLDKGELDFAVCPFDRSLMRNQFSAERLVQSRIVAATAPGHPLTKESPVTLRALFAHPVALPVLEPMYLRLAMEILGSHISQIPGVIQCSDFLSLLGLGIEGNYAVLGPTFAFQESVAAGTLTLVELEEQIPHELYLFQNRRALPVPTVQSVIGIVRELAARLNLPG